MEVRVNDGICHWIPQHKTLDLVKKGKGLEIVGLVVGIKMMLNEVMD